MENGDCYVINSSTVLYHFPTLTCTEGGTLPVVNNIRRDTYIRGEDGKFRQTQYQTNYSNTSSTTVLTTHIWDDSVFNHISPDAYVLPATLVMLSIFWLIFKMVIGLRR